jgi:hypothetical protein
MEPEGSLKCSQQSATVPYPDLVESDSQLHTLFRYNSF